ncbi:MAG: Hsp20/alpha crystallin family protein [Gammaproteobacteria bacterium]
MTQLHYEPWHVFNQIDQAGRALYRNKQMKLDQGQEADKTWSPTVDIRELDDSYVIYADIPGVDPSDIELSLEDNVLTISGERVSRSEEESKDYKRVERLSGHFLRRFSLPESIDIDTVTANSNHGVLEVVIPKQEKVQARRITVNA